MKNFEHVKCSLCKADNFTKLYTSRQYGDKSLGEMEITIVMCNECNFIYQNPQLTYEALATHYQSNSSGDIYRETGKKTAYSNLIEERKEFISDVLLNENLKNIADVGGGSGVFLSSLDVPFNTKKYLIDPSNAVHKNTDIDIIKIQKNFEELSIEIPPLNLLMCINVLEHIKNPSQILKNFNKNLDNNGVLFIEVPNSAQPQETFAEYFSYEHVNHFTHETLHTMICKNGFYPIKISSSNSGDLIRFLARKKDTSQTQKELICFFEKYINEKDHFSSKITEKIYIAIEKNTIQSLCIYGAGDHTRFLLSHLNFLIDKIDFFIDSDLRKWGKEFYGKKIISPEEIKTRRIQHILISSQRFEDEICKKIQEISNKIQIITLYQDH